MKTILFSSPKGDFKLTMPSLLFKIFWRLMGKKKIKYKFYEAPKEIKGEEFDIVIVDEFAKIPKDYNK